VVEDIRDAMRFESIVVPQNFKEKMFCVVAYIPKATVPAAIGAVPLAAGVASGDVILAVAVLSILVTAPVGSAAPADSYANHACSLALPPAQTCLIFRMVALWTLRVDVSSTATIDAVRKLAEEKIADVCGTIRSASQTEMAKDYLELPLGCLSG